MPVVHDQIPWSPLLPDMRASPVIGLRPSVDMETDPFT